MTIQEYLNTEPLTNRKVLITALLDEDIENEGTYRITVKHMNCPYTGMGQLGHCEKVDFHNITDETCFSCKQEWLDKEI